MDGRRHTSRMPIVAVVVFAGAGAWISGQLVQRHAGLWATGNATAGAFERVCRAAESVGLDCAVSQTGRWREVTFPIPVPERDFSIHLRRVVIPVAFLGLAYFVFMGIWFGFVGRPHHPITGWQRTPLVVGWVGVAVSVCCSALMLGGWAPVCVWCAAAHMVNLLMVAVIHRMYRRSRAARRAGVLQSGVSTDSDAASVRLLPASRLAAHAVVFALIIVAGLWYHRHEQLALGNRLRVLVPYKQWVDALRQDPDFLLRDYYAQQRHDIPPRPNEPMPPDRPRLVVFTDFECSACYCSAVRLGAQVLPAFDEQLTVAVRHYPLCDRCNRAASGPIHANACAAAYAAEAARLQGGEEAFCRMVDLLFENRKRLSPGLYHELAVGIGLDAERFRRDFEGEQVRRMVREDVALARALGVESTPTMFLNGRRITAFARDNPVFWQAVARAEPGSRRGMHVARATVTVED